MESSTKIVIAISRQLGSGGSYVGQRLAKRLGIFYADRVIIRKAAEQLSVLEEDVESRDEKGTSFWKGLVQSYAFAAPDAYLAPAFLAPSDRDLYKAESEVIRRIADEHSAVILGRCGAFVLRDRPDLTSVFLHADMDFRRERVRKLYDLSDEAADKMIAQSDKDRALYYKTFAEAEWTDARRYDLAFDTSKIGLDEVVELILASVGA